MKKRRILFISIIAILIAITGLYVTYASNNTEEEQISEHDNISFNLSGDSLENIVVLAKNIKLLDIKITNPYENDVTYGVAYQLNGLDNSTSDIEVAESSASKNSVKGIIKGKETISVSIVVSNQSEENVNLSFSVINGYIQGGSLSDNPSSTGKTFINTIYQVNPPNSPKLTENLIPVYYDETNGTWKTASYTNNNNEWYDYNSKKWANAVLLTEEKRDGLTKDYKGRYESGQVIGDSEDDGVLAFYVWIPRYKYKVWNINKIASSDSYDAYNKGIDIIFEIGTNTTGTIQCDYKFDVTTSETEKNEKCTGSNGEYYTHPAFTFGDDELTGFWIGKFELSSSGGTIENSGGANYDGTPRILPNNNSWRNVYLDIIWKRVYDMQEANNEYGLTTNREKIDSHIITGLDWGAVAYLSHSKYGRCTNNACEETSVNNSGANTSKTYSDGSYISVSYTGRSGNAPAGSIAFSICGKYTYDGRTITADGTTGNCIIDNSSYSSNNINLGGSASTTGNIYGVYDMAGGSMERIISALSNSSTAGISYTYFPNGTSDNNYFSYNSETKKYLVPYAYGTSGTDQTGFNRSRLGDATAEIRLASSAWYGNFNTVLNNTSSWNIRGGSYRYATSLDIGIFFSAGMVSGGMDGGTTSRAKLAVFN